MIDQGLRLPCKDHPDGFYFGYGGDFGDECNDLQFCINGMFSPDREPHPAVSEIKFLQQPAVFWPLGDQPKDGAVSSRTLKVQATNGEPAVSIVLGVTNRYAFLDLSHLAWSWHITCDLVRKSIHVESFELISNGEKCFLRLDAAIPKVRDLEKTRISPNGDGSYFLNLRGFLKSKTSWADSGHVLVTQQFPIIFDFMEPIPRDVMRLPTSSLRVAEDATAISVFMVDDTDGVCPLATVNRLTGALVCYAPEGQNLLAGSEGPFGGVMPNFTRAGTDNDKGGIEWALDWISPGKT